jgi:putative phosphoribosyl transferase
MNALWDRFFGPGPLFHDRVDAGAQLAEQLESYRGRNALVLGIPRGGVPVAAEVARRLDADLDVIVARKLGAPISAELAIGAVTANGGRFLNEGLLQDLRVPEPYLERVTAAQRAAARQREERLRDGRAPEPLQGRIVIVVDDGLATGATMRAAVRSVVAHRPAWIVVAVPVGSPEACAALQEEADEVICLYEPEPFWAVGLYYEQFQPTEDAEVQWLLEQFHARGRQPEPTAG